MRYDSVDVFRQATIERIHSLSVFINVVIGRS
jgi:hypothetical protein